MASKAAGQPRRGTREWPRSRSGMSVCAAAGMAATALAGALVMTISAPQRTPGASRSVLLTAGEQQLPSLEQAIQMVLDATNNAQQYDVALPFATETSNAALPTILQNTNYELLISILSRQIPDFFFRHPELVAGDAANPRQLFQFFTPDFHYQVKAGLDPDATYQLTGAVGKGTEHLAISAGQISTGSAETHQFLESGSNLVVNPDGTFTVTIASTEPEGAANYIDSSTANSLLIRDMMGNWALGPGNISIECTANCPEAAGGGATGLTEEQLIQILLGLAHQAIGPFNQQNMELASNAGINLDPNTMSQIEPETFFGVGLPTARTTVGNFDLDADQALIVKVPEVDSAYSGIQLMNVFGSALPPVFAQTTLNNTHAFHAADGFTYYVVSATNPGVANWLDSGDIGRGEIIARFEGLGSQDPEGDTVTTQVVPVDEVANYLPEGTPTVSASEFAADMTERVLSYDYALDVSRQAGFSLQDLAQDPESSARGSEWLVQQVLLHDIQDIMGADQFHEVFGAEPFTPLWARLTPALSPDWLILMKDILTNPQDSFAAIQDNLNLAIKDIVSPALLAFALLQQDPSQFGTILSDALFDPNNSITAGILNARDDLATAIFTANGGFPTHAGPLATLEWQFLPQLAANGWDFSSLDLSQLSDLPTVLNPTDYLAELFG